jgi:hypothetical protein
MSTVPAKQTPATGPPESIEVKFRRLAAVWLAETAYVSSSSDLVAHPAFQEIVGMGPAVIPLLLRELHNRTGHWHRGLRRITGAGPVPPADRGNIDKAAELRMVEPSLEEVFPGLRGQPYPIKSPRDRRYNCIAFAAGDERTG